MYTFGIFGGTIAIIFGIVGGIIGTWIALQNANSKKEKQLMLHTVYITYTSIIAFLLVLFLAPRPYHFLVWPYPLFLPALIIYRNKKLKQIREESEKQPH